MRISGLDCKILGNWPSLVEIATSWKSGLDLSFTADGYFKETDRKFIWKLNDLDSFEKE